MYEEPMLDLDVPAPRHPALALYGVWATVLDYHKQDAPIGDRVILRRGPDFDDDGEIYLYCKRHWNNHFSLWPDGSFRLNQWLSGRWRWWEQHTFLSFQWAIRERVLTIRPLEGGFRWLDERNYRTRVPYLPVNNIWRDVRYRLTLDGRNHWIIKVDPRAHLAQNGKPVKLVQDGYAFAERRYDRFQRRAENAGLARSSNPLGLRTKDGLLSGDAAIEVMASHMLVYPPRGPKEAQ